ncbi:MAG TPA: hypothetical protein VIL64_04015 [Solirubrobacteraceae bacterium]
MTIYHRAHPVADQVWFACRRGARRALVLYKGGEGWAGGSIALYFRIDGYRVAYIDDESDKSDELEYLHLVDVRTGQISQTELYAPPADLAPIHVTHLVLPPGGQPVWIVEGEASSGLYVNEGPDAMRQVDAALPGALGDLSVSNGVVSWTHHGAARNAPMTVSPDLCPGRPMGISNDTATLVEVHLSRLACLRATGRLTSLQSPSSVVRLAGPYAAVATPGAKFGDATIKELELRTGETVGPDMNGGGALQPWFLAPNGTVAAVLEGALWVRRLGGEPTLVDPGPVQRPALDEMTLYWRVGARPASLDLGD